MKAILELAETRRSVRKFSKEKVALEDVLYTLDVARHAPSGANEQPWKFIIVENKDVKRKIKEACEKGEKHLYDNVKGKFKEWLLNQGLSHEKPFLEEAPFLVIVLMKKSAKYSRESVWVAIGHILLALEEKGLKTLVYTPSNTDYPAHELDVPKGYKLEAILPIGHSLEDPTKMVKRGLAESVYMNGWGNPLHSN